MYLHSNKLRVFRLSQKGFSFVNKKTQKNKSCLKFIFLKAIASSYICCEFVRGSTMVNIRIRPAPQLESDSLTSDLV